MARGDQGENAREVRRFTSSTSGLAVFVLAAAILLVTLDALGPAVCAISEPAPVVDGTVTGGEYANMACFSDDSFRLYWRVMGDMAFFAMSARTAGYLGVGFDPENMMKGADMVVGWVDANGTTFVHDAYSSGRFGPVVMDTDLGGTDDLREFAGSEAEGLVVIEFSRPLSTGDIYDNELPPEGELSLIWATGSDLDPASLPNNAGLGMIDMASGDSEEAFPMHLFYLAGLGSAMAASMMMLFLVRRNGKGRRSHLVLGAVAAAALIGTFLMALAMGPGLVRPPLTWTALFPLTLFLLTMMTGYMAVRGDGPSWERWHVRSGALAFTVLAFSFIISLIVQ